MKLATEMRTHAAARLLALLGLALAVLVIAGPALAQEPARTQGALEEVIVTAQKRAENVQNVPIAMQAYNGEALENAGISQITDVTRLAPNLNVVVQNSMSQHIVIRGVGTNEFFGNAPSSVGTYIDEVTMNSSYMSTLALFDMERVEVLRGPQNSLFGRNTTGGAVNYITKQPVVGGDSADGDVLLTYGNNNLAEVEGGVTIPTGSTAAIRLAGLYHSRDGIWKNLDTGDNHYGDEERYSGRATIAWEPSEATRLTVSLHSARARDDAQPQKMAGAIVNNPPLRINDTIPPSGYSDNINWEDGNLNTIGGIPTVNIEGFDRLTQG